MIVLPKREEGLPPIETSWSKLENGWGVRVYGTSESLSGRLVEVKNKAGKVSQVLLGDLLSERGAARIYSIKERK